MKAYAHKIKIGEVVLSPEDILRMVGERIERAFLFMEVNLLPLFLPDSPTGKNGVSLSVVVFGEKTVLVNFKPIYSPIGSTEELKEKIDEVKVKDGSVVWLDEVKDILEIKIGSITNEKKE